MTPSRHSPPTAQSTFEREVDEREWLLERMIAQTREEMRAVLEEEVQAVVRQEIAALRRELLDARGYATQDGSPPARNRKAAPADDGFAPYGPVIQPLDDAPRSYLGTPALWTRIAPHQSTLILTGVTVAAIIVGLTTWYWWQDRTLDQQLRSSSTQLVQPASAATPAVEKRATTADEFRTRYAEAPAWLDRELATPSTRTLDRARSLSTEFRLQPRIQNLIESWQSRQLSEAERGIVRSALLQMLVSNQLGIDVVVDGAITRNPCGETCKAIRTLWERDSRTLPGAPSASTSDPRIVHGIESYLLYAFLTGPPA